MAGHITVHTSIILHKAFFGHSILNAGIVQVRVEHDGGERQDKDSVRICYRAAWIAGCVPVGKHLQQTSTKIEDKKNYTSSTKEERKTDRQTDKQTDRQTEKERKTLCTLSTGREETSVQRKNRFIILPHHFKPVKYINTNIRIGNTSKRP